MLPHPKEAAEGREGLKGWGSVFAGFNGLSGHPELPGAVSGPAPVEPGECAERLPLGWMLVALARARWLPAWVPGSQFSEGSASRIVALMPGLHVRPSV
jgi:hypothetical protein